jgi:hypothetical protein
MWLVLWLTCAFKALSSSEKKRAYIYLKKTASLYHLSDGRSVYAMDIPDGAARVRAAGNARILFGKKGEIFREND